jgi:lipoprotein-anchoring transpeptidase ErfK/SrfK
VALALFVLFAGAGALLAYDVSLKNTIAHGVKIAGVDVGGLSAAQARKKVRAAYATRLANPVALRYGNRRFELTPRAAHLSIDIAGSVQQALSDTRAANLFSRVWRSLTGGRVSDQIEPGIRYSQGAVNGLVSRVANTLDRPARDASISYSGNSLSPVGSQTGLQVATARLASQIGTALSDPGPGRELQVPVVRTQPSVTTAELAQRYPTIITVDRSAFTLKLWKHLRLARSYTIAVGMIGLETPAGLYHVQDKQVDPSWHVPNSAWAGSLAGQTIPPGPADPLKARWMGIYNGAGIHGTDELSSLGTAASHGCIRMRIPDVIDLYSQTPLGTPVYIE